MKKRHFALQYEEIRDIHNYAAGVASCKNRLAKLEQGVGIFIIIDSISEQLSELIEHLAKDGTDVRAIPFEIYKNHKNQLRKFTTFTKETLEKEAKKWTFKWNFGFFQK